MTDVDEDTLEIQVLVTMLQEWHAALARRKDPDDPKI
jgi:hypothetical protein